MRYPALTLYELLRLFFLLRQGARSVIAALPVTWFASIPLLALVPMLFFMLASDEERYGSWLPLIALVKALSIASIAFFAMVSAPTAIRFAAGSDLSLLLPLLGDVLFCGVDAFLAAWCLKRSRALCR